jgi:glutaredoxin 3
MALPRFRRTALGLMLASLICVGPLSGTPTRGTVAEPRATVREDVPMHAGMGADSRVVGQLQKGEVVTIDIELNGHAGQWCRVIQQGKTTPAGYVPCGSLDREERTGRTWKYVATQTRAQPEPALASHPDVPKPVRDKRPYADVKALLYYAWGCPQCTKARALLQSLGVSITEYDIEREPTRKEEMVAKSGQEGVPVIDIEGMIFVGFGESYIREAVEKRRASD